MILYKQKQSGDNKEAILMALDNLDKPVSSREIKQYLKDLALGQAKEDFTLKFTAGEIDGQDRDSYVSKHSRTMDLRTIQRWIKTFHTKGYVERKEHNKYVLSITGKRELQFREYAQAYGTIALNHIMDFLLPTMNSLDRNLIKLVEIFGTYVVYALIEATRLVVARKKGDEEHWRSSFFGDDSNFRNGKFREGRLVNTWIKDIFDPWYMLNMFLTAISNSANDTNTPRNNAKKQEMLLEKRLREDLSHRINALPIQSVTGTKINNQPRDLPPSTLDLIIRRFSSHHNNIESKADNHNEYLRYINIRSKWCDYNDLSYEPDSETIAKLKNSLTKEYPLYSGCLQKVNELFYSIDK